MFRLIILLVLYLNFSGVARSQQIDYGYIDSLSYQQYINGQWNDLLKTSELAKKANITYPNLSMRIGYSAFMLGNYSLSLKHYNKALEMNSFNENAHYYMALNNLLLSRREAASFSSKYFSNDLKKTLDIGNKKIVESFDIESSIKPTNSEVRKTGQYYRIGIESSINYRWKLYQSVATYRQNMLSEDSIRIFPKKGSPSFARTFRTFLVNDFQYYLKSEFFLNSNMSLLNAFHYTKTNFDNSTFSSSIFHCGLKLIRPFADYKLEINGGPMLDSLLLQMAFSSTYYPLGNLNFYGNSRLSVQNRTNLTQVNYSQMFGFKLSRKIWLETHATFGQIKNLIDNESLYIYDALDAGNFRIGATLKFPLTPKFTLLTNYYYEQKNIYLQNTNYNLNSLSIGLKWKL